MRVIRNRNKPIPQKSKQRQIEQMETGQFVPLENYPELCKNVPCILGIDEAGRGPVLGPLVYSIFICPLEHQGLLKELGVAGMI
jgi:ribonuclease H2 subunit A